MFTRCPVDTDSIPTHIRFAALRTSLYSCRGDVAWSQQQSAQHRVSHALTAACRPLLCFQVLTHIIESSGCSGFQALQMQENIKTFEDILGGCERLLRTPLPVSYTRHTSRFLILWLSLVPFALVGKLSWATVPVVGFIALLLLGARLVYLLLLMAVF